MKKRILCFGDSNTWGYMTSGGRFDEETRWPMRLEKLLGPEYTVIEEGFNGRTCVFDDPIEGGYKSGLTYLPPCVMSHSPLDLVILMPVSYTHLDVYKRQPGPCPFPHPPPPSFRRSVLHRARRWA